jgi:hypothetical protein
MFSMRSKNCKKWLLDLSWPSVRLSVRISIRKEQLEISYLSIFRKTAEKIQITLKYDKIAGILHEDAYTFMTSHLIRLRMVNI